MAVVAAALLAPGEASATAIRRAAPSKCPRPPVEVRVESTARASASTEFGVTDAVARRVPIVPTVGTTSDPKVLAAQQKQASRTKLALYSVYLADFRVPRRDLSGFGFGDVTPPTGNTVAILTMVPPTKKGLAGGDRVTPGEITYRTTTSFAPLGLLVRSADGPTTFSYDTVEGRVDILALDRRRICVDFDVVLRSSGEVVAAAKGAVQAPIVRSAPNFYFT